MKRVSTKNYKEKVLKRIFGNDYLFCKKCFENTKIKLIKNKDISEKFDTYKKISKLINTVLIILMILIFILINFWTIKEIYFLSPETITLIALWVESAILVIILTTALLFLILDLIGLGAITVLIAVLFSGISESIKDEKPFLSLLLSLIFFSISLFFFVIITKYILHTKSFLKIKAKISRKIIQI